jgi:hypothetical protein
VIGGQAFTADDTAIIRDDKVFTADDFAYQDPQTGNVLTILDPLHSSEYSVVADVIAKDGEFYTFDPESFAVQVGTSMVAFTLDYFAYIDPATNAVYTESGEQPLPSAPVVSGQNQARPVVNQQQAQPQQ